MSIAALAARLEHLRLTAPVTNEDMVGILALAHEVAPGSSVDVVLRGDRVYVDAVLADGAHLARQLVVVPA